LAMSAGTGSEAGLAALFMAPFIGGRAPGGKAAGLTARKRPKCQTAGQLSRLQKYVLPEKPCP
jgi:hypothetical protein